MRSLATLTVWVIARILSIAKHKSFRAGNILYVTPQLVQRAEDFIVKDVQETLKDELTKTDQGKEEKVDGMHL